MSLRNQTRSCRIDSDANYEVMKMLRSLLVGLKSVDPQAYGGWDGRSGCLGCELDVDNIARILDPLEYQSRVLKTKAATAKAVLGELEKAASQCEAGDLFLFYFSGHGGQNDDGDGEEEDGQDETLVVYDREIIDDEIDAVFRKFRAGVRIFMLSDSCNSGTNYRMLGINVSRSTPIAMFTKKNRAARHARSAGSEMQAQLIHYGGCRDGATSAGYEDGGEFTKALCAVWNGGQFDGDYQTFYRAIKARASGQDVQFSRYGPVESSFLGDRPFGAKAHATTPTGSSRGNIKTVKCLLEISDTHLIGIRSTIRNKVADVLTQALDDALSQRAGSASVSCTGSSNDGVSCTGSVTVNW